MEEKKDQNGCWVGKGHCEPQLHQKYDITSLRTGFLLFIFVVIYLTTFDLPLLYIQGFPYNLFVVHKELICMQACPQGNMAW